MSDLYSTKTYSFDLPEDLIASEALAKRDSSRLLVVNRATRTIEHRTIQDLPEILNHNYEIVVNNTRVFRARLLGERVGSGGKVEFFMLKKKGERLWQGLMKAGARVTPGFEFKVGEVIVKVVAREDNPAGVLITAEFSRDPIEAQVGEVPLPPYIVAKRLRENESQLGAVLNATLASEELETYNTTFAREDGSVAAPTAGRHFTPELIRTLQERGIGWHEITLHVGLGTFKPVSVDDIRDHQMHPETATISSQTSGALNLAKKRGKKILAVGTTTTRTLEGMAQANASEGASVLEFGTKDVDLFIHPAANPNGEGGNYPWRFVDAMLTNFHLPESTLLMMVASFVGDTEWTHEIYRTAIEERYRFYSYGDAMLIL
jgi:S-adenosylmethionine:tRNA ribosyltransferase-isomerase